MELSVTELERLWILCANHADKCKEGGNKQKYYNDLAKKLYNAANRKAFKN